MTALRLTLFALTALLAGAASAAQSLPIEELNKPGRVLMLRHAHAPGTGDPGNFRLDDCSTQRNLDAGGREQARRIGERLARAGITRAKVYSSQWCRCLETARLLGIGDVSEQSALNSIYNRPQEREARLKALDRFIATLPKDGPPVVLVTHQFTISEFTGSAVPSGGGELFQLDGGNRLRHLGAIAVE